MKAPKKIYIIPHTLTDGFCHRWFEEPFKVECIEYTRTEALIDKAWDWIEDNMLSSNQQDNSLLYYEQFKKYLEE